jgi:hypothetical protein
LGRSQLAIGSALAFGLLFVLAMDADVIPIHLDVDGLAAAGIALLPVGPAAIVGGTIGALGALLICATALALVYLPPYSPLHVHGLHSGPTFVGFMICAAVLGVVATADPVSAFARHARAAVAPGSGVARLSRVRARVTGVGQIDARSPRPLRRWDIACRRFAVLATPRTGSELLIELLASHPQIWCESEILADASGQPELMLRSKVRQAARRGQVYGFKFMPHHAEWQPKSFDSVAGFLATLNACGFELIVLRRRRLLHQALSVLVADQVGYHPRQGDEIELDTFEVDPALLLWALAWLDQQQTALEQALSDLPYRSLYYEDDLESEACQHAMLDRFCSWLDLPPVDGNSTLIRPVSGGSILRVANRSQIAAVLRLTRFAALASELEATADN